MGDEAQALEDWSDEGHVSDRFIEFCTYHDIEPEDYYSYSNNEKDQMWWNFNYFNKATSPKYDRANRPKPKYVAKPIVTKTNNFVVPDNKQLMQCHCGNKYLAKKADLKRGWGLSCSKQCAARRREFNKPAATEVKNV